MSQYNGVLQYKISNPAFSCLQYNNCIAIQFSSLTNLPLLSQYNGCVVTQNQAILTPLSQYNCNTIFFQPSILQYNCNTIFPALSLAIQLQGCNTIFFFHNTIWVVAYPNLCCIFFSFFFLIFFHLNFQLLEKLQKNIYKYNFFFQNIK